MAGWIIAISCYIQWPTLKTVATTCEGASAALPVCIDTNMSNIDCSLLTLSIRLLPEVKTGGVNHQNGSAQGNEERRRRRFSQIHVMTLYG
jgi:hypothetical protein